MLACHQRWPHLVRPCHLHESLCSNPCSVQNQQTKNVQVVPGELTIITGVPNSGKSEWIDALLVNLAWQHGWCFAMCSMEKKVRHSASTALQQQCCGQRL